MMIVSCHSRASGNPENDIKGTGFLLPAFAGDKLRRNDRYGAFSFPYSLSSLMISDFRLIIEISVMTMSVSIGKKPSQPILSKALLQGACPGTLLLLNFLERSLIKMCSSFILKLETCLCVPANKGRFRCFWLNVN